MLTPEYLDGLTDDILAMYDALNESIIEDMSRRIVKTEMVTETAAWQMKQAQEMGALYEDVIERISEVSGYTADELKKLFEDAGVENIRYENDLMSQMGLMPIELRQSETMMKLLKAGLEKTSRDLTNLTLTTAIRAQNAYYDATNLAYLQVSSGVLSYQEAVKRAVLNTAKEGVTVLYPSGHTDKIDVAIRRAVLTGVNQTASKMSLEYCDEAGCDFVETTAHSGARPSHAVWQGRVFCRSGKSNQYPAFSETGYGTGAGLCGWNCRHSFHAFFPGVSIPAYTQKMLDDYNAKKYEYQGEKLTDYECSQLQRTQERKIRKTKRQLAACNAAIDATDDAGLKSNLQMEFENKSALLKNQEIELKDFCKKTKRSVDSSRLQIHAVKDDKGRIVGFDRSVSQKAVQANMRYRKIENSDIINISDKQFGKKVGKHTKEYGLNPQSSADRQKIRHIIFDIVENADEIREGDWRSQEGLCQFYIKGPDVVVTRGKEFVTILKGGVENERVKNARKREIQ